MAKLQAKALIHQYKYVHSKAKYPLLVAGYGSGKTHALIYRILRFLTEIPKCTIGAYMPTVDLAKKILFPRLEEIFAGSKILYKLNRSEGVMQIWMPTGKAEIIFRSMDNYARIIGFQTTHAVIDEIDTLSQDKSTECWVRILARNRKAFKNPDGSPGINTVGVTSTPEGYKFLYHMWVKEHGDNPDYEMIKGRTEDNFHLPPDYVESLRATYSSNLIEAYLNGEFCNLTGNTVYEMFDRFKNDTKLTLADFPSAALHIGADFNIGRSALCVAVKGDEGQIFVLEEGHHLMDTPAMISFIQNKYPKRTIIMYPDASGRARKSVDASKSDHKLLRDAGFRINAPKKNPPVRERVVSVQASFLNAKGERNLFINVDACPNLVDQLSKQIFDATSAPEKNGHEDPLDALGYVVNRINGLNRPTTTIARMRMGI